MTPRQRASGIPSCCQTRRAEKDSHDRQYISVTYTDKFDFRRKIGRMDNQAIGQGKRVGWARCDVIPIMRTSQRFSLHGGSLVVSIFSLLLKVLLLSGIVTHGILAVFWSLGLRLSSRWQTGLRLIRGIRYTLIVGSAGAIALSRPPSCWCVGIAPFEKGHV